MPRVQGRIWRRYRARKQLTSDQAAKLLCIAGGALRQIELYSKPASDLLIARAAKLYGCDEHDLMDTEDPVTEPPSKKQEKETNTGPTPRRNGEGDKRGPRRVAEARSA